VPGYTRPWKKRHKTGALQDFLAPPARLLVSLFLVWASTALADTITLRTGERLVGKVISEKPKKVVFESQGLGRIEIPREGIERIQRDEVPPKPAAPPPPQPFQPPPPAAVKPTVAAPAPTNAPAATATSTNPPAKRRWFWLPKLSESDESSDWIQLKSGEWLRGRLYGMQNRTVEFESDELDELTFDWKDIHQVQLPRALVSYGERQTAAGALRVDRETVTITGAEPLTFPREELIGIAPGQLRELDYWSGKLNVGLNISAGNTEQADFVTKARLERRTPNTHLKFDYTGNFSETEGVESVENQRVNGSFNIFLTRRLFLVTPLVEYYRDPFQNIGRQTTIGGGAGYYFIDRPKVEWLVLGGPAYQHTRFDTVVAGEDQDSSTPAFFLQSSFEIELTKRIDLELSYQAIVTSEEAGRVTHHSTATLEIDLTRRLDLDVSFIWDRAENPQANSAGEVPEQNDFRLNLSFGVKF
jgi:putative salt-induced outer membrane protein YdiY